MRMMKIAIAILIQAPFLGMAIAAPSTMDVKKKGELAVRQVVDPVLTQYCHEQCKIIHVETEVDVAVDDLSTPGFEDHAGKAVLAPASGKVKILMDENLGAQTRNKVVNLIKEHLEELDFSVQVETKITKFPQPASSGYKVAELRERITRDVKASMQSMLAQFCPESCILGEFDLQSEVVNPDDVDYSSSQDFFQDGPAAIRVRGVKATILIDQGLAPEEAASIVEMAKAKTNQFKNSQIQSQVMKFPRVDGKIAKNGWANGLYGRGDGLNSNSSEDKKSNNSNKSEEYESSLASKTEKFNKHETNRENKNETNQSTSAHNDSRNEKFERYEKIERVENGDAVQQYLDKFRMYGIVLASIMLALLITLVAISFRKQIFETKHGDAKAADHAGNNAAQANGEGGALSIDEKASLIGKRIEAQRLFDELTGIYSEQPKVAKHVFTHVLTEEGVETTAQYLEIFGESVVMELLRDPGLQADLSELMDFYSRNTFDINDEERMQLLKKLHHRTVTAKMQVHGSRSAVLFDFLADMDSPQIVEMIKNESNTVKAIVLTQCDQKKRQALFNSHDDVTRMKLMTELSRIDHLPKNYIYNVASALRRKKNENPKLNTEALPGTDVLVTFLEKASVDTQRTIIHQLMSSAGADTLHSLKSKLASLETLRFMKDQQLTEAVSQIKHDELVQFLKGCPAQVRDAVLSKAPADLSADLRDELALAENVSREAYMVVERKMLNRIKVMANNGQINLAEINERMFAEEFGYDNMAKEVTGEVNDSDIRRVG